jgi:hypothetical protein
MEITKNIYVMCVKPHLPMDRGIKAYRLGIIHISVKFVRNLPPMQIYLKQINIYMLTKVHIRVDFAVNYLFRRVM